MADIDEWSAKNNKRGEKYEKSRTYLKKNPHKAKKWEQFNIKLDDVPAHHDIPKYEPHMGGELSKQDRQRVAEDTVSYCDKIKDQVDDSKRRSVYYDESYNLNLNLKPIDNGFDTKYHYICDNVATVIYQVPKDTAIHNMSSAKNPGGGFLNGSIAWEEVLALISGLYCVIKECPMYAKNTANPKRNYYHNEIIYSPDVPFFKTDSFQYCKDPNVRQLGVITCPAVNRGAIQKRYLDEKKVEEEMKSRIDKVLHIACINGHKSIVTGAWGCGVFRNDIETIARLYAEVINEKYAKAFENIYFVSLDQTQLDTFQRYIG